MIPRQDSFIICTTSQHPDAISLHYVADALGVGADRLLQVVVALASHAPLVTGIQKRDKNHKLRSLLNDFCLFEDI